ncbi:aspartate carbamoyltransferase, partial [Burkholderia pseudomallei]
MTVPQQAFLRDAMRRLNMTREAFANRIGVSRRALDTWLLPDDSQESRGMPEIVERFVSEIVERAPAADGYAQSVDSRQPLAQQFLF